MGAAVGVSGMGVSMVYMGPASQGGSQDPERRWEASALHCGRGWGQSSKGRQGSDAGRGPGCSGGQEGAEEAAGKHPLGGTRDKGRRKQRGLEKVSGLGEGKLTTRGGWRPCHQPWSQRVGDPRGRGGGNT